MNHITWDPNLIPYSANMLSTMQGHARISNTLLNFSPQEPENITFKYAKRKLNTNMYSTAMRGNWAQSI